MWRSHSDICLRVPAAEPQQVGRGARRGGEGAFPPTLLGSSAGLIHEHKTGQEDKNTHLILYMGAP